MLQLFCMSVEILPPSLLGRTISMNITSNNIIISLSAKINDFFDTKQKNILKFKYNTEIQVYFDYCIKNLNGCLYLHVLLNRLSLTQRIIMMLNRPRCYICIPFSYISLFSCNFGHTNNWIKCCSLLLQQGVGRTVSQDQ